MYLDIDLEDGEPIAPWRWKLPNVKRVQTAIDHAIKLIEESGATAGQIGIYTSYLGECLGYVIKYPDDEPYFEEDEGNVDVSHIIHA